MIYDISTYGISSNICILEELFKKFPKHVA